MLSFQSCVGPLESCGAKIQYKVSDDDNDLRYIKGFLKPQNSGEDRKEKRDDARDKAHRYENSLEQSDWTCAGGHW